MNLEEIKGRPIASGYHNKEERDWLIAEVERLRKRLPGNDAPWTLKELDDAKARAEKAEAERDKLIEALYQHRADLHCYSSRPCPTCRNSAEVLGIADKVPYCCARVETDSKALAEVKKQGCICVNEATSKNCPVHGKEQGG